jgi:adenosylhomocysteine nucleosidase
MQTQYTTSHSARTAILSALPDEQRGLIDLLEHPRKVTRAGRDFWLGELHGHPVALALSRIGKVSAALTAAVLIEHFDVGRIVFTGVAGGLGAEVSVGDVVVAGNFIHHDLDASPLFARYEVPLYGRSLFACDAELSAALTWAASAVLGQPDAPGKTHGFVNARVHQGLIASGDLFVSSRAASQALQAALRGAGHEPLAVEMEGAAVAQVCADYAVPFAAMRTVSDRADDDAHLDFARFVDEVASQYALLIVKALLVAMPASRR